MADSKPETPSYEELLRQNQALRTEIAQIKAKKQAYWVMLAGTNRRLQMSSAAIKAAVSSLLNYDIFWDGANQHEFLETINSSIDQAAKLTKLLTLAFHLEAGSLHLKREPQVLQEIISLVQSRAPITAPGLIFGVTMPQDGMPVLVDYEYLRIVLDFLLEVLAKLGVHQVGIQAIEEAEYWALQFEGLDENVTRILHQAYQHEINPEPAHTPLPPEYLLMLHVVYQILFLQNIQIDFPDFSAPVPPKLRLVVPIQLTS